LSSHLSVNRLAWKILGSLCEKADELGVRVEKSNSGVLLVDCGIEAKGGFQAGKIVTEICMGGCGKVEITRKSYGEVEIPTVLVYTNYPAIATLGSQFAGWQIKEGDFSAIGSGPARALALKPKKLYDKIGYKDECEKAVVVLETEKYPPEKVLNIFIKECGVTPENLAVILVPTTSLAGSVQIAGRIVETGVHKLERLGFDPKNIVYGFGMAPIAPIHPKFIRAMGRTNDSILYGGTTYYVVDCEDEEMLKEAVSKAPSSASKDYGKPFFEIFKEVGYDFYKIDPNLFAPAVVIVNNLRTGRLFKAGAINSEVLLKSLGFES